MIVLYHSIVDDTAPPARWCIGQALPLRSFQRQLRWLSRALRFLPLSEYLEERRNGRGRGRKLAALTFDDGLGSTFRRIFPFLRENGIPATFFISTGHLEGGKLLWFCYLNALCFENDYGEISWEGRSFPLGTIAERVEARHALEGLARRGDDPSDLTDRLQSLYPLRSELLEEYGGMTHEQLRAAADWSDLEIGSHTVTHPFLSRKSRADQAEEINNSRQELSTLTGRRIRYFAYPAGDYDEATLTLVKEAGFEAGFATVPRKCGSDPTFELPRIGVYSTPLWKVRLKAWGVADLARRFGLRIG